MEKYAGECFIKSKIFYFLFEIPVCLAVLHIENIQKCRTQTAILLQGVPKNMGIQ